MRFGTNFRSLVLGSGVEPLPPRDAFVVTTTSEFNDATSIINQPDNTAIYNSWGRFSANDWYPGGVGATGEALSWNYDSGNNNIVSTVNSTNYIGFVSPDELSHYTLTTTLASTNADDDTISVIVAFRFVGNQVRTLNLVRTHGGGPPSVLWGLVEVTGNTHTALVNGDAYLPDHQKNSEGNGWASVGLGSPTRVWVKRTGNLIEAKASPFGSSTIQESSLITYTIPSGSIFEGPANYGFGCWSQNASTFTVNQIQGGFDRTVIYDLRTMTVYRFNGTSWVVDPTTNVIEDLGYPRVVTNPETGNQFFVDQYGISQL